MMDFLQQHFLLGERGPHFLLRACALISFAEELRVECLDPLVRLVRVVHQVERAALRDARTSALAASSAATRCASSALTWRSLSWARMRPEMSVIKQE